MGAFNLTAAGIWAVDRVYYGKRVSEIECSVGFVCLLSGCVLCTKPCVVASQGRPILRDRFEYALENREYEVLKFREKLAKAAAAAEKEAAAAKK